MGDIAKVPYGPGENYPRRVGYAVLVLASVACIFLSTCDRTQSRQAQNSAAKPLLVAEPNPIPAGDPDKPVASTQIKWDTGNGAIGELYVKIDREDERFIGRAPSGVMKIDWIQFVSVYEFRLYAKKRSKLLATLTVTRDD